MAKKTIHSDHVKRQPSSLYSHTSSYVSIIPGDVLKGNATRRDYPLDPNTTLISLKGFTEGKFRVVEKPDVKEAYTLSLVSFSNIGPNGVEITSCVKLVATSRHSERRVKKYPSEIIVVPSYEYKTTETPSMLVKRLVLFKQLLSLYMKESFPLALLEIGGNCHIRSITVDETHKSNIIMFEIDNQTRPCYLADENNQCDCKLVLSVLSVITNEDQGKQKSRNGIRHKNSVDAFDGHSKILSREEVEKKMHVCRFCDQGFVGGKNIGTTCDHVSQEDVCIYRMRQEPSSGTQAETKTTEPLGDNDSNKKKRRGCWGRLKNREKDTDERNGFRNMFCKSRKNTVSKPEEGPFLNSELTTYSVKNEPEKCRTAHCIVPESLPLTWKCKPVNAGTQNFHFICKPAKEQTSQESEAYGYKSEIPVRASRRSANPITQEKFRKSTKEWDEEPGEENLSDVWSRKSTTKYKYSSIIENKSYKEWDEKSEVENLSDDYPRKSTKYRYRSIIHNKNDVDDTSPRHNHVGMVELSITKILPYRCPIKFPFVNHELSAISDSSSTYSSSEQNRRISSSPSNVSYLNFSRRNRSRTLFPQLSDKCCGTNEHRRIFSNYPASSKSSTDSSKHPLFFKKFFEIQQKKKLK